MHAATLSPDRTVLCVCAARVCVVVLCLANVSYYNDLCRCECHCGSYDGADILFLCDIVDQNATLGITGIERLDRLI